MKKSLLPLFLFTVSAISAQVGINTSNPQNTFHIDAGRDNPSNGTPSTSQQNNDVIVTSTGAVGIGTISPTTKVDIAGNLRIGNTSGSAGSSNVSSLVRDNTTGEVKVSTSSTGNTFPINYITYTLSNVNGDYISNYDTQINDTEYTVAVIGSSFSSPLAVNTNQYYPLNVFAFKQGNTWRLTADYRGGSTVSGNGDWVLYCIIINNSLIKTLNSVSQNLGGQSTASATSSPAGL